MVDGPAESPRESAVVVVSGAHAAAPAGSRHANATPPPLPCRRDRAAGAQPHRRADNLAAALAAAFAAPGGAAAALAAAAARAALHAALAAVDAAAPAALPFASWVPAL